MSETFHIPDVLPENCYHCESAKLTAPIPAVKERPLLFSCLMILALLNGTKTQTRRAVKVSAKNLIYDLDKATVDGQNIISSGQYLHVPFRHKDDPEDGCRERVYCPYGEPGDRLWCRETFKINVQSRCIYAADAPVTKADEVDRAFGPWKPSIFMPRWASRITLEITSVRVERVRDISEEDAKAEGVSDTLKGQGFDDSIYRAGFQSLWDSINGEKYPWASNPWVWVISFPKL